MSESTVTGRKDDQGKPQVHLVPPEYVYAAARAFTFGAAKYAKWNWTKGLDWTRISDAAHRHLFAFMHGEEKDPESGLSHLDHLAACVAMLVAHAERGLGTDDRPQSASPSPDGWELYYSALSLRQLQALGSIALTKEPHIEADRPYLLPVGAAVLDAMVDGDCYYRVPPGTEIREA
jgi:hypothetical protein